MLKYIILICVVLFLLQKYIESFEGVIKPSDIDKDTININYIDHNGESKNVDLLNVPSIGRIETKVQSVIHGLINPYNELLDTNVGDIPDNKQDTVEDKIKIKDIYGYL